MQLISSLKFFLILITLSATVYAFSQRVQQTSPKPGEQFVCLPCGRDCDNDVYEKAGKCTHCQMSLVKRSTVNFKTIQASKICSYLISHPNVLLLDVRTKEEFEGRSDPDFGTLKNAINIPIQLLPDSLESIAPFKNKQIIVFCSHSHRSPQAAYLLTQNGFTNVTNMSGGMSVMTDIACKK